MPGLASAATAVVIGYVAAGTRDTGTATATVPMAFLIQTTLQPVGQPGDGSDVAFA